MQMCVLLLLLLCCVLLYCVVPVFGRVEYVEVLVEPVEYYLGMVR